ncbi:MAG: DUF362 domain-containing protein [Candidatus Bathyarchaeia archaeon]
MNLKSEIGRNIPNKFIENGKMLISKVTVKRDLKESILHAVNLIGGFKKVIESGDEVLLKPNYNSADPPPASTDPKFLRVLVELLYEHGAGKVVVGESSMQTLSTRKVMEKTGALKALSDSGAELVFFDEGKWVKIDVDEKYLKKASLPERALRADKLVYCCCMKTHFKADFSFSLKLAVGFLKGSERIALHLMHLKEKIVDLNLVVHPNLIVMDGRKCFITGGPFSGEKREPNVILASGDRIAMDVESIKIIESFDGAVLKGDPWSYTQIKRAVELGLGAKSEQDYQVISE